MSRVLCVRIRGFVEAVVRRGASIDGPLAVLESDSERSRVMEACADAVRSGVRPGATGVQARAACPGLHLASWPHQALREAQAQLEEALRTVAPSVDDEGDGVFFLDGRGLERLYGGRAKRTSSRPRRASKATRPAAIAPAESGWLEATARAVVEAGHACGVGLADVPFVAFAATYALGTGECATSWSDDGGGVTGHVVVTGEGRAYLASLPLELLPVSDTLRERISGLGLRTLGAFAALPPASVETRYGLDGLRAHRLARGEERSVPSLVVPDQPVRRSMDVIASSMEHLRQPVCVMLGELMEEMRGRDRAAITLGCSFSLENGELRSLDVTSGRPSVDAKVFWRLLALGLSRHQFSARVEHVTLEVRESRRGTGTQGFLFGELEQQRLDGDATRLDEALSWLRSRYGAEAVARPVTRLVHRPEHRTHAVHDAGRAKPGAASPSPMLRGELAPVLRLIDPPALLRARGRAPRLEGFAWAYAWHRVRTCFGPQRLSGEWWEAPYDRDYFEVLTHNGGLYWIYWDRAASEWRLQGLFD